MENIRCEKITSRKNPKVIAACALSDKKARDKSGLFCAEGAKLLDELLKENIRIRELFYTEKAFEKFSGSILLAESRGCSITEVTDEVYAKLSEEKNPEGIFAAAEKFKIYPCAAETPGNGGFLILDRVQNPSNVGAIIRNAAALGISRVLLGEGCADVFSRKTLRAAMGTVFKLSICITDDICRETAEIKAGGSKIFGAALAADSEDLRRVCFDERDSLVIGSEGSGISEKMLDLCDKKIIIPMRQNTESLNAAAAAAVLIWEKQRNAGVLAAVTP